MVRKHRLLDVADSPVPACIGPRQHRHEAEFVQAPGPGGDFIVQIQVGPVYAGVAYQTEKATGAVPASKFTRVNGSYDLGVAKLLAGYGRVAFGGKSTNEWQFGADVPLSSVLLISGGVARSKGGVTGFTSDASYIGKSTDITLAGAADADGSLLAVGVLHTF